MNTDLLKIHKKAHEYYTTLNSIISPALGFEISFPSESFKHIKYMAKGNVRDTNSQIMRYKLLPLGIKLIAHTNTFQEYEETTQNFVSRHNSHSKIVNKKVLYWGLIAIIDDTKIKVIIRKIGNGSPHFWSIVPAWMTNKKRDAKYISLMKGNPIKD